MYTDKTLKINGGKTQFLKIKHKNEENHKITINIDNDTKIEESETINILGFIQNRRNTMDTHLNWVATKVGMTIAQLEPAMTFVSDKVKQRKISAKVKYLALYGLQLIIGQSQQVVQRACAILMCIKREMFTNHEALRSTSAICKKLGIDKPRQEIVKAGFKFINKIIENKKTNQITAKLRLQSQKNWESLCERRNKIYQSTTQTQKTQKSTKKSNN